MTKNYNPNIKYRGGPVPPEEVDLEKMVKYLHTGRKRDEENVKVAEQKWKNPIPSQNY